MEDNLMIFEDKKVEVFKFKGKVLFNPKHVAECLDIVDVKSSIRNFNEKQVIKLTNSKMHNMHFRKLHNTGENFLTESGVYKLIFKSKKKEAEKFQDWVTDEVLPQIRKTGGYIPIDEQMTDDEIMARALIVAQNTIKKKDELIQDQNKQIKEMKPLVGLAERFANINNTWDIGTYTKILNIKGLGRNNLFRWLKDNKILMSNNIPYQQFTKYFKVLILKNENTGKTNYKPMLKPNGVTYIYKRLIKDGRIIEKPLEEIFEELKHIA